MTDTIFNFNFILNFTFKICDVFLYWAESNTGTSFTTWKSSIYYIYTYLWYVILPTYILLDIEPKVIFELDLSALWKGELR